MKPTPKDWEHIISNIDRVRDGHDAKRAELIQRGEQPGESEELKALTVQQVSLEKFRATLLAPVIKGLEAYAKPKLESEPEIEIDIEI